MYFFDSYAIIEVLKRSPSYAKYANENIVLTILNLIEVTQYFLEHYGESKAKEVCESLRTAVMEVNNSHILNAVKFRSENKKKSLSYADCLGYIYSKQEGMLFLTGDHAFERLPNVEFVK